MVLIALTKVLIGNHITKLELQKYCNITEFVSIHWNKCVVRKVYLKFVFEWYQGIKILEWSTEISFLKTFFGVFFLANLNIG